MSAAAMQENALREWAAGALGHAVVDLHRLTGGASRVSYRLRDAGGGDYLLRVDTGEGPLSGTPFDLAREHRVLSGLHASGFPVPAIIAFNPALNALLMAFVPGHNSFQKTLAPAQEQALQQQLIDAVVALQRLPPAVSGLVDGGYPSAAAAIGAELDSWEQLYRERVAPGLPAIDFALGWLRRQLPSGEAATLVHGDIGPGNFLFDDDGRLLALIDWELVHIGHPLEDLACVLCRALGAPFGEPRRHIERFEQRSGRPVARAALDYAIVLVLTRWCIGISMALSRPTVNQDVPMLLTFRQSNMGVMVRKLAAHYGIAPEPEPEPPLPPAAPTQFASAYLIESLEQIVAPACADEFARHRVGRLVQLAQYLRDFTAYGSERYRREELAAIQKLTGRFAANHAEAQAQLRALAGAADAGDNLELVRYLLWHSERERRILTAAMGAMAERDIVY
jgi:aminoglycoside phosphotransferase (APT) family kinase protein